uniref:Uncharacterized protein n=1 Tax=Hyaloperonospora arabidopsidis (strain Emoy2) TaxID=559515 RepID=M4C6N8_HYAAE
MTRSPNGVAIVSHSLPADMHHVHLARFMTSTNGARASGLQPPRAPLVGSMPEPHFLQLESMPDLALGPPAETIEEQSLPPRAPAVVQFASSCPGNVAFLRSNPTRSSWTPTLAPHAAEHDDFDLSKSPALAALREMMSSVGYRCDDENARQVSNDASYRSSGSRIQSSRHHAASGESSSYAVSAELFERLSITSEDDEEKAEDRDEHYCMPRYNSQISPELRQRSERHGSYGNLSDTGDTGIFEFDDQ